MCDADGLQLPKMPRADRQPPVHLAGKGKPRADDLQDLLALWLVCSQGRAWSPAFLQGLSTYFLLKTKYTKSPPSMEWNSGLCPLPPKHIWEPFPRRAEQLHGERGREGRREGDSHALPRRKTRAEMGIEFRDAAVGGSATGLFRGTGTGSHEGAAWAG